MEYGFKYGCYMFYFEPFFFLNLLKMEVWLIKAVADNFLNLSKFPVYQNQVPKRIVGNFCINSEYLLTFYYLKLFKMRWNIKFIIFLWLLLFAWTTYDLYLLEVFPWKDVIYSFLSDLLVGLLIITLVQQILAKLDYLCDQIYSGHIVILARLRQERYAGNSLREFRRVNRPWNDPET